jgi:hypothetical protein
MAYAADSKSAGTLSRGGSSPPSGIAQRFYYQSLKSDSRLYVCPECLIETAPYDAAADRSAVDHRPESSLIFELLKRYELSTPENLSKNSCGLASWRR